MRAFICARRPLRALALVTFIALAGCGGRAGHTPSSATPGGPVGTPTATSAPRVLYSADWSKGLADWQATAGWKVEQGALQSDTGDNRQVTIPFEPVTSNYAVEYTMQVVEPKEGGSCVVAAAPSPASDGYQARLDGMLALGNSQFALHPQFGVTIDPMGHEDLSTSPTVDFELGTHVTTYRIEVRGPLVIVLVNGRRLSPPAQSTTTATLSTGPLTISCSLASARFSSLTISSI